MEKHSWVKQQTRQTTSNMEPKSQEMADIDPEGEIKQDPLKSKSTTQSKQFVGAQENKEIHLKNVRRLPGEAREENGNKREFYTHINIYKYICEHSGS